ncbi:MAG: galactose-1-phosphate uridylyltransferase [Promethearchaeota archaeon]
MGRLRWNSMLGEWVIMTPRRADRPFQEEGVKCPFCPNGEETKGNWDVLTVNNEFPALTPDSGPIPLHEDIVIEAPAFGACKVIITSRKHDEQIENMKGKHVHRVLQEYLRVFKELDEREGVEYVAQFENRGKAIGVSQDHPHAQVYALPFVPPKIEREVQQFAAKWESEEVCLLCETIENETKAAVRVVKETKNFVATVPFSARLPYEMHIYPKMHVGSLIELEGVFSELGVLVRDTVTRYSALFDENAYVMIMHTRPSKGEYPYWHFHIEFYPPWRDRSRRKHLAGIEEGTGTYTNDSIPELTARELREAI